MLAANIALLPLSADVVVEDEQGWRYQVVRIDAWGTKTDEPFLRIVLRPLT